MMNNQRFYKEIEAHFNLRTNKTKKPEMVYLVVRIDGKQYKLSSGVKVYPSQWHKGIAEESNLLCKRDNNNNKIVNEKLTVLKKRYSEFISYLCNCDTEITDMGGLLKQYIYKDMINKKEKNAVEYINEAFENYYKSRNATVQTKNDCKRKIENYFIPYVKEQKDQSINILRQEGFSKWAKWLTDKTSPIVINDTLQLIVRLIKQITIDYPKLELTPPIYNKVQVEKNTQKKNEGKPLTKAEIEAIEKFEPKNDTQKATKILFLIGLETGARSSDWNKFIEGDYEQKGNNKVLIIHPQKTERKEGNDAYVTLTPKLEQLVKEARDMDIFYVDRDKNDKLEDKGRSHKTRVIMTTFRYNLRKICETINKNTSGELFGRQKLVSKLGGETETKPAYEAISSHWARHTFVHECKLKGMPNETIAKKIGDSVAMVEQNYGFMDKEEIAEQVLKAEEDAKKEGTKQRNVSLETALSLASLFKEKVPISVYEFDDSLITEEERFNMPEVTEKEYIDNKRFTKEEIEFIKKTSNRFEVGVPSLKVKKVIDSLEKKGYIVKIGTINT